MDRRQLLAASAATLGLTAAGYAFFAPVSDEELIAQLLDDLAGTLSFSEPIGNVVFHGSHLSKRFEDIFTDPVRLRVSEVRSNIPGAHNKLGMITAQVLQTYSSLDVSLSLDSLSIQEDSAEAQATATVTASRGGQLQRDTRTLRLELVRSGGDWRIAAAWVTAPR